MTSLRLSLPYSLRITRSIGSKHVSAFRSTHTSNNRSHIHSSPSRSGAFARHPNFPDEPQATQSRHYSTHHRSSTHTTLEPTVHPFFEPATGTFQYIVAHPPTNASVIIDPVLDYSPTTSTINTSSASALLSFIAANGYRVRYILETHAHADQLAAATYLQSQLVEKTGLRPRLLHQSLQINVRDGRLPEVDESGIRMLRVPLNLDAAGEW